MKQLIGNSLWWNEDGNSLLLGRDSNEYIIPIIIIFLFFWICGPNTSTDGSIYHVIVIIHMIYTAICRSNFEMAAQLQWPVVETYFVLQITISDTSNFVGRVRFVCHEVSFNLAHIEGKIIYCIIQLCFFPEQLCYLSGAREMAKLIFIYCAYLPYSYLVI